MQECSELGFHPDFAFPPFGDQPTMVPVHLYGGAGSASHRQGAPAREQLLPGTNHTGLEGRLRIPGGTTGEGVSENSIVCVTTVRVCVYSGRAQWNSEVPILRPAGNRVDSGCEAAALTVISRHAPVPCNGVASSWKTLAGELAGGGGEGGRLKEVLPGPCCALIGHGEIDGLKPPRSPPPAQDGSGWTCHLASLSGSPGPIGHQCGMSPDCKLELRVRRVCARVFARACVFSERRSFSELDSSPPECPDGADSAAPQGQWRVPRSRWRGVSVRRWTRG